MPITCKFTKHFLSNGDLMVLEALIYNANGLSYSRFYARFATWGYHGYLGSKLQNKGAPKPQAPFKWTWNPVATLAGNNPHPQLPFKKKTSDEMSPPSYRCWFKRFRRLKFSSIYIYKEYIHIMHESTPLQKCFTSKAKGLGNTETQQEREDFAKPEFFWNGELMPKHNQLSELKKTHGLHIRNKKLWVMNHWKNHSTTYPVTPLPFSEGWQI